MNILVIGASKGIGRQVVKAGLAGGHSVTAFSRRPEMLDIHHRRLRLQAGDVLDAASVKRAVAGQDAVVCALGLPSRQAIGSGDSVGQCTPLCRLVLRRGLRWLFAEKDRQEQVIKNSRLDWTLIRPTALTNGPKKGVIIDETLRSGVLTQISRADVAAIILEVIDQPQTRHQALTISYPPRLGDSWRWIVGYFG